MKKPFLCLCMASILLLGLATNASAADYNFSTTSNPDYYKSTNYEDRYDAAYQYGARNQIDYDIPEMKYGLSQEFLESSLNTSLLMHAASLRRILCLSAATMFRR